MQNLIDFENKFEPARILIRAKWSLFSDARRLTTAKKIIYKKFFCAQKFVTLRYLVKDTGLIYAD